MIKVPSRPIVGSIANGSARPILIKIIVIILVGIGVFLISRYVYLERLSELSFPLEWARERLGWKMVVIAGIIYAILLSIPFFPGVELAWLVILLFGKQAAPVFYVFTILGLCWSFFVGRWLERSWLTARFDLDALKSVFSHRIDTLQWKVSQLIPTGLRAKAPTHLITRPRYIILAILVNLPGNSIIGGGGGIAFMCGANRAFNWKGFILTIALAVSPVPILIITGLISPSG